MAGEDLRLFVLREFDNIVNDISDEEFYQTLSVKECHINWMKTYRLLKAEILNKITDEWNTMWEEENMNEKINTLENLKGSIDDSSIKAWRPEAGNIEPQRIKLDVKLWTAIRDRHVAIAEQTEEKMLKLKEEVERERNKWNECRDLIRKAREQNSIESDEIKQRLDNGEQIASDMFDFL